MLKLVRRLGLGSPDAPSIPGMQVVDWRILELPTSNTIIALCHKDSVLYITAYDAKSPPNTNQLTKFSSAVNEMRMDSVDLANIYPRYTAQFALYCKKDGATAKDVYIKHTRALDVIAAYGMSAVQTSRASQITAHEASICDRLGLQPHANIAQYLGVQVRDELDFEYKGGKIAVPLAQNSVVGLVFKKYDCTLHEMVIRRQKIDVKLCLQSISAAIEHMHYWGVVHGDIRPQNVYVERGFRDHFVVGDFDCAQDTGSVIALKTGDSRWSKRKQIGKDTAQEDDDWSAFRTLMEWLVRETGGQLVEFKGIGKARVS
ncbi:hypothetical protein C7974DRAFT_397782 [Boeremia exigua]|uniref:uncharacterized protein n=1 Tax=Boeremia exigua TaxID=749465 RepID=UPI001E8DE882|nr:uncharacterized protein C7974DRAFT_397782 [Boeremia exigua]KAH6622163.1 hypothetical protein C7974DRAFT_397782 [Boeremia exigua]